MIEAESAERALEILHDGADKIDLVITDVVMPKMDGPSLIKEVRELYPDRALKVIFMSGYTEDNFRKRLGDDVDIHFLPKPFSLKQLAGKVKEVMTEGLGRSPRHCERSEATCVRLDCFVASLLAMTSMSMRYARGRKSRTVVP